MFRKIKFLFLALCAILCFSIASACTPLGPDGDSGSNGSQSESVEGGSSSDGKTESGESSGESSGGSSSDSTEGTKPEEPICEHTWEEGYCPLCQTYCSHDFGYNEPTCYICQLYCEHDFTQGTGKCANCNVECMHSWSEGVCWNCNTVCKHTYEYGYCTTCSKQCWHPLYEDGVCAECKMECFHQNGYTDGVCNNCFKTCEHSFNSGWCSICQYTCPHTYANGNNTCSVCLYLCYDHNYTNGVCYQCQHVCPHNYTKGNATCLNCAMLCAHDEYTNGVCKACGVACTHEQYTNGTCNECNTVCPHVKYTNGVCDTCAYVCSHTFIDGVCKGCGAEFALTYLLATSGDYYTVTGANDNTVAAITIPATHENKPVKKIASEAFKNYANLTTVTLSEGLEEIGSKAFYGCSKLSSCNIPSTVTNIGEDIMENVTALTYENNVCYLGNWAISYDNRYATSITVKAGTVGIAESAFADGGQSTKLSSISLPASLQYIGKNAFYNCSALEEIDIPNGVKKIQPWTFAGCSSLANVTLSSTLSAIYPYAFENCASLTEIDIPQTVSLVDKTSFSGTNVIQTVNNINYVDTWAIGFSSSSNNLTFRSGTLGIAQNAFQNFAEIMSVDFSGIQHIGYMAFAYCSGLTEIILPDSVLTVGANAFNNCSKVTNISIGKGVKRIEEGTFAKTGNTVSRTLSISNTIEYLGKDAFYGNIIQPIEFNGTAEDWLAIEKVSGWCNFFQVHCLKDGKYLNSSGVEYTPTNN